MYVYLTLRTLRYRAVCGITPYFIEEIPTLLMAVGRLGVYRNDILFGSSYFVLRLVFQAYAIYRMSSSDSLMYRSFLVPMAGALLTVRRISRARRTDGAPPGGPPTLTRAHRLVRSSRRAALAGSTCTGSTPGARTCSRRGGATAPLGRTRRGTRRSIHDGRPRNVSIQYRCLDSSPPPPPPSARRVAPDDDQPRGVLRVPASELPDSTTSTSVWRQHPRPPSPAGTIIVVIVSAHAVCPRGSSSTTGELCRPPPPPARTIIHPHDDDDEHRDDSDRDPPTSPPLTHNAVVREGGREGAVGWSRVDARVQRPVRVST